MTSNKHVRCLDRVYEAANKINLKLKNSDIVVCVQGDEPLLTSDMIKRTISVVHQNKKALGSVFAMDIIHKKQFYDINNLSFSLEKNSTIVQEGNTSQMLWKIDELISYSSQFFTLKIGDVLFTGTPPGVGSVVEEDVLKGFIESQEAFSIKIK